VRVVKVILTGGGSKVMNLDRFLADELNIKVIRGLELATLAQKGQAAAGAAGGDGGVDSALAFAYALSGLGGARSPDRIDALVYAVSDLLVAPKALDYGRAAQPARGILRPSW
jgi:hypothetical protein